MLPIEGDDVPIALTICNVQDGEQWTRRFGDKVFHSRQSAAGGLLVERFGLMEFRFQLSVEDGSLVYRQQRASIRAGALSVALLSRLAARIAARESRSQGLDKVHVAVRVELPGLGLLVSYEGDVEKGEAA